VEPDDVEEVVLGAAERGRAFAVRAVADPAILILLRSSLEAWLRWLHWPADERCALVHAANEACTNVIEHAYGPAEAGEIELTAWVHGDGRQRQVVLAVQDQGRWQAPERSSSAVGGLALMRALTHRVDVQAGPYGTRVGIVSCAVP
jgi:serine/threonine-protein kinase RsbW